MNILIAADMEGISGVVNWDQVSPGHSEYERFRKIMTSDVNAAIEGALQAGAGEIVVADGHAGGDNLLLEDLNPQARLNSGNSAPFAMLQGIDANTGGVLLIGYHACAGSKNAVLDHTWSSARVANLWLNHKLMGEIGLNAALCGHFDAPVLMVSGDQTACGEARALLGGIVVVVVKQATGRTSAECLPVQLSQQNICEAAAKAVRQLTDGKAPDPFKLSEPITVTVEFLNSLMAEQASRLPGAERLDGRRIEFSAEDMPHAYTAFQAAVDLASP
ncbi:MAG TPA: M55 family metallopeptidase [Anaerolineales bacterium]|nr:M55 family metallopeptidase [Anaerolineales bacterium]